MCIEVYLNRKREKGKYPLPRSNILIFLQVAVVHFLIIIWYLFRLLFTETNLIAQIRGNPVRSSLRVYIAPFGYNCL
jgi:hypothetical protein